MAQRTRRPRTGPGDRCPDRRCAPEWITTPQVQSALGAVWYDLGQFEKARKALLEAIRLDDRDGMVPIYDIAKLANAEARLGEARASPS